MYKRIFLDANILVDIEDTIQYIMAKKVSSALILSNDKGFVSEDIELLSSKKFLEKLN